MSFPVDGMLICPWLPSKFWNSMADYQGEYLLWQTGYVKTLWGTYIHQLTIGAFPCADCAANLVFFMKRLEGTWKLCEFKFIMLLLVTAAPLNRHVHTPSTKTISWLLDPNLDPQKKGRKSCMSKKLFSFTWKAFMVCWVYILWFVSEFSLSIIKILSNL